MRGKVALLSFLSLLSLVLALAVAPVGATAATATKTTAKTSSVTSSSLGNFAPTFVGPAATGCKSGCSLLTGPTNTPSTANVTSSSSGSSGDTPASDPDVPKALVPPHPRLTASDPPVDPAIPSVSCKPLGPGCDTISGSSGGATGVKGLNAVDSGTQSTQHAGARHRARGPGPVCW